MYFHNLKAVLFHIDYYILEGIYLLEVLSFRKILLHYLKVPLYKNVFLNLYIFLMTYHFKLYKYNYFYLVFTQSI